MVDSVSKSGDGSGLDFVRCRMCSSGNIVAFGGEVAIHFRGAKKIDLPTVWVFPELAVCLDCGTAQFTIPKPELRKLVRGKAAGH
jgi:hypothetical protein